MAKKTVKKTRERLLADLDDQLYLLRVFLEGLQSGEMAHSKAVATILRNLICYWPLAAFHIANFGDDRMTVLARKQSF